MKSDIFSDSGDDDNDDNDDIDDDDDDDIDDDDNDDEIRGLAPTQLPNLADCPARAASGRTTS